jgi:hypothetical protein
MDYEIPSANTPHNTGKDPTQADRPLGRAKIATEVAEMKQWVESIKLNTPIPRDLLPLLAKDDAKQMEIVLRHMSLEHDERSS